jgi:subtilisin family serine protease
MRFRTTLLILFACLATACTRTPSIGNVVTTESAAQQLLITTRQNAGASSALLGDPNSFYLSRRDYGPTPSVDRLLDDIAYDYGLKRIEGWLIAAVGVYCEVYELKSGASIEEAIRRISADPRVESVQAMNIFETQGVHYDDPYASMQPAIAALEIDSAHERATGRGVTVAVIDSSVDERHPEFRGRVHLRRDLVDARASRTPEVHGTAIAGIIASTANNSEGIVGVAPDVEIASLRACWTVDSNSGRANCSSFSLAQALQAAILADADIINLSLAGPYDPLLGQLIDVAIDRGTIVVAAMPDSPDSLDAFPASHPKVIAAQSSGSPAAGSGLNLVRAPGAEVLSTTPNASYGFFSGNSMSAAYVAGVTALLVEREPGIRSDEVLKRLVETGGKDSINACRAVATAPGDCPAVIN